MQAGAPCSRADVATPRPSPSSQVLPRPPKSPYLEAQHNSCPQNVVKLQQRSSKALHVEAFASEDVHKGGMSRCARQTGVLRRRWRIPKVQLCPPAPEHTTFSNLHRPEGLNSMLPRRTWGSRAAWAAARRSRRLVQGGTTQHSAASCIISNFLRSHSLRSTHSGLPDRLAAAAATAPKHGHVCGRGAHQSCAARRRVPAARGAGPLRAWRPLPAGPGRRNRSRPAVWLSQPARCARVGMISGLPGRGGAQSASIAAAARPPLAVGAATAPAVPSRLPDDIRPSPPCCRPDAGAQQ